MGVKGGGTRAGGVNGGSKYAVGCSVPRRTPCLLPPRPRSLVHLGVRAEGGARLKTTVRSDGRLLLLLPSRLPLAAAAGAARDDDDGRESEGAEETARLLVCVVSAACVA